MESYLNETSGLYTHTFQGEVRICGSHEECIGRSFCAMNYTKLSHPGMCMCHLNRGHVGLECESTSPPGMTGMALTIIYGLIGGTLLLILGMYQARKLYQAGKFNLHDTLNLGLSVFIAGQFIAMIHGTVATVAEFYYEDEAHLEAYGWVLTLCGNLHMMLIGLSLSLISFLWLSIVDNTRKMTSPGDAQFDKIRWRFFSFWIFVLGFNLLAYLLGIGILGIVSIIVFAIPVILLYVYASIQVQKLLTEMVDSSGISRKNIANGEEYYKRIILLTTRIRIISRAMGINMFMILFFFAAFYIVGGSGNQHAVPGNVEYARLITGFAYFFVFMVGAVEAQWWVWIISDRTDKSRAVTNNDSSNNANNNSNPPHHPHQQRKVDDTITSGSSSINSQTASYVPTKSPISSFNNKTTVMVMSSTDHEQDASSSNSTSPVQGRVDISNIA